jgi:hypothetical protein
MNIYQKINQARLAFQNLQVKKTGYNKHLDFWYYTLDDILPNMNKICSELGLFNQVTFNDQIAMLIVKDIDLFDNPDNKISEIVFLSPTAEATVKGGSAIQGVGSMETYVRRYLYLIAYEITEPEALDKQLGKPEAEQKPVAKKMDKSQVEKLLKLIPQFDQDSKEYQFISDFIKKEQSFDMAETVIKKAEAKLGLPS